MNHCANFNSQTNVCSIRQGWRDTSISLLGFLFLHHLTNEADMRSWQEDIIFQTQREASSNKLQQREGMRERGGSRGSRAGRRVVCSAPSLFLSLFSILDLFLKERDRKPSEEVFLRGDERKSIVKKTLQSLYLMSHLKYIFWFTWHVTWHCVIISFDAFCTRWQFYDFCSGLCLYECSVCNFFSYRYLASQWDYHYK